MEKETTVLQIDGITKGEREEILKAVLKINRARKKNGKNRATYALYKRKLLIDEATRSKEFSEQRLLL